MKTRTYKCSTKKTATTHFTLSTITTITFEDNTPIKDVEQYLKDEVAREFTKGSCSFTAKDISIKLLEKYA